MIDYKKFSELDRKKLDLYLNISKKKQEIDKESRLLGKECKTMEPVIVDLFGSDSVIDGAKFSLTRVETNRKTLSVDMLESKLNSIGDSLANYYEHKTSSSYKLKLK